MSCFAGWNCPRDLPESFSETQQQGTKQLLLSQGSHTTKYYLPVRCPVSPVFWEMRLINDIDKSLNTEATQHSYHNQSLQNINATKQQCTTSKGTSTVTVKWCLSIHQLLDHYIVGQRLASWTRTLTMFDNTSILTFPVSWITSSGENESCFPVLCVPHSCLVNKLSISL